MKGISVFVGLILLLGGCHSAGNKESSAEAQSVEPTGVVQLILTDTAAQRQAIDWVSADGEIYQWKNRLIFYGSLSQLEHIREVWSQHFPADSIQIFSHPYYVFDRSHCAGPAPEISETEPILLSANLVDDPKKQEEYMAYHRHQFEEWPEVAAGFCKAQFQQVLCYREGRQLLLVINIPKGADFDSLNKKTTENNPRVDEWNQRMAPYQEGLPGTTEGETWVFFAKQ